ncbi:hypothetical protein Vadar_028505 [Vaccinium darrowii]|uniref:Uncharacterized protein n=1 Tax=Vaccinium darrowii TaxID=229202 RepID=A0ACB7ZMF5_9ERIC|nr:hypothetical protein Vadar_028505 [Vaccinium darrowii]
MISASVKRLWDVWDLRILVLLSLTLQILLSVFGYRRKYVSLLWLNILVWSSYLMADQIAIIALSKLSDSQVGYDKGNALWAIWAPLLLLHLGGPDSITAFSLQDNQLWMRRLCSLGVQFYIAVNVILISWKHSWFSTMSILALVAGLIKYGERIWVLVVVTNNFTEDIMPFQFLVEGSDDGISNTEDAKYVSVLRLAHKCFLGFWRYIEYYDLRYNTFIYPQKRHNSFGQGIAEFHDINLFWQAIEVEMGLMFDVLYTKVAIRLGEVGWILRCITFSCTVTVLIGLIIRLISTREDQEKWHKADIAITEVLLVGALALEIYGIISLYLSSDWAMLWLINHKRGKQAIQFRKRIPRIFLPKQYSCKNMAQFSLLYFCVKEKNKNVYLRSLLGKKYILNKYALPPVAFVPSDRLFRPLLDCCRCLMSRDQSFGKEDKDWTKFFSMPLEDQIMLLHFQTELWIKDDAPEKNRGSAVSQHTMAPSGASSSRQKDKEDKELCRTLSRYMMHLLVMRRWLLPVAFSDETLWFNIDHKWKPLIVDGQNVSASFQSLVENEVELKCIRNISEDERWPTLKRMWVRILCTAASKGHRNEHLQQLSQGYEFITFLWFFLPQSRILSDVNPDNQSHAMRAQREGGAGLGITRV